MIGAPALAARLAAAVDLYEYQGKQLFARFGIPVSEGRLATTPGGGARRGRGARRPGRRQGAGADRRPRQGRRDQARRRRPTRPRRTPSEILGLDIRGHVVRKLWIEQASDIAKEYYLSVTFDRGEKKPLFMFTTEGGDRHRGGRRDDARGARAPARRPARGLPALPGAPAVYGAGIEDPSEQKQIARDRREALRRVRRLRRDALRDQPADRHARRRGEGARLEVHGRRQRALQAPGHRRDARPRGGRPARGARSRARRASPT